MASRRALRIGNAATRIARCFRTDAWLSVRMLVWRLAVPVLKRGMTVDVLADMMRARSAPSADADTDVRVQRIRQLTLTGGRLLVSRNCLTRALVLYRLLSHAGEDPVLVLGARQNGDTTAGHAWIEIGGGPFPVPEDETYAPVVRFSAGGVERIASGLHGRVA